MQICNIQWTEIKQIYIVVMIFAPFVLPDFLPCLLIFNVDFPDFDFFNVGRSEVSFNMLKKAI